MANDNGKVQLILDDAHEAVVVRGGIAVYQNDIPVFPAANDSAPQPAAAPATNAAPKIGNVMPKGHKYAGWIYFGISKTTHKPSYTLPKDSCVLKWNAAMEFAAKENARAPSAEELNQLYEAKNEGALKGTFNETGSDPASWYWSAEENRACAADAWVQSFVDGYRGWYLKSHHESSLRLVGD